MSQVLLDMAHKARELGIKVFGVEKAPIITVDDSFGSPAVFFDGRFFVEVNEDGQTFDLMQVIHHSSIYDEPEDFDAELVADGFSSMLPVIYRAFYSLSEARLDDIFEAESEKEMDDPFVGF